MNRPVWQLDIGETHAAFRRGDLLPSAALAAILKRLDSVNGRINAFAALDRAGAEEAARASDRRWQEGKPLGPLDGVALTIKDNITVKGLPCAWGTELFRDFVPDKDELPVARLRGEGAIILGKTTVSEFTVAQTTVNTRAFGTTRNPWNLARTTGASSGGAGAAVASGIGAAALGTDGGGSIRRPSCHCGLVGLKPTLGRVARRDGLPIILHDCEVIGPIARTVDSLALVFAAIAKPHPEDRASLAFTAGRGDTGPAKKRILYTARFGEHRVDDDVASSCAAAARNLAALGHVVEEGPAPFDTGIFDKHWGTISQAGLAWMLQGRAWQGKISELHAGMAERGAKLSAVDYIAALAAFRELQAQMGRFFESYDLLMTPTAGALPWPAEEEGPFYNRAFTGFVNAAGLPGISIPCDPAPDSLPIGFQLVAPFGADWDLIDVARAYEKSYPWAQRWPDL